MIKSSSVPQQEIMIQLLTVLFPSAKVYLFGSRVRGDHADRSDRAFFTKQSTWFSLNTCRN